jgi:hypothetical protein
MEGFEPNALVILNLVNPKEKFFGVLKSLSSAGVTLRGINIDSFEDWIRQIVHDDEPNLDLITMFIPLFRVERMFLDEPSGSIKSLAQHFEQSVGITIAAHLDLDESQKAEGRRQK